MSAALPGRPDPWADAVNAAALLAIDPDGLKGVVLRTLPGPARDAWLEALKAMLPLDAPMRRAPAHIDDERLLGGLDLAATLAAGRPIASRGLMNEADGGVIILAMAERCAPATGARFAMALDSGEVSDQPAHFALVALEEGFEPDERAPAVLTERLAFALDLSGIRPRSIETPQSAQVIAAREDLARMKPVDERTIESICTAAGAFGVISARAAAFTLRAARASAALAGRASIEDEDLALAARLVLAPRACFAPPEQAADVPPPPTTEQSADDTGDSEENNVSAAADRVIEAV
ncbi:MAG: hypothetical protein K2X34_06470, partial [Hyphomonadaceae bacterium]|nr:hypothetical protein [Hyphomonadaceae bacterium]